MVPQATRREKLGVTGNSTGRNVTSQHSATEYDFRHKFMRDIANRNAASRRAGARRLRQLSTFSFFYVQSSLAPYYWLLISMRIWCIRHGEATHNISFITSGESAYFSAENIDSALTQSGEEQARACHIPPEVTLIAVSPLRRALQTEQLAHRPPSARRVVLEALCEFPRGHTPNIRLNLRDNEFPDLDWSNVPEGRDTWEIGVLETPEELARRVRELRAWIQTAEDEGCAGLALVAHTSVLQELTGDAQEMPHAVPIEWKRA